LNKVFNFLLNQKIKNNFNKMIDDLESNILREDKTESTSNKFLLTSFSLPRSQQNISILSMSTSKKFIYLVTDRSELLRIESESLRSIEQAYTIPPSDSGKKFYEHFTKIWTDREGNHSIIRSHGGIYYFNSAGSVVKELKNFKGLEVCAVGFDDRNTDSKNTGNFLVADFENNIYECSIAVEKIEVNGEIQVKDSIEKLTNIIFKDSDADDDEEQNNPRKSNYDRIYGIRFFRATKKDLGSNENASYIIVITKNRLYQFTGPGITSFKQIFGRFERNPTLFNESCKFFPQVMRRNGSFNGTDLDILYKFDTRSTGDKTVKIEVFNQFGWKTESGYCFGQFIYDNNPKSTGLPYEFKNFTVIPFAKITSQGQKEIGKEPNCAVQTLNHIFILYKDCITVISKLTSNIVHTQYCQIEYDQMVYNEFAKNNGIILLSSKNGLYQISLKDENRDLWKDYLEIGDYQKALNFCDSERIKRKINRIEAENDFDQKQRLNSVNKFANSDEKFEIVCLKFLMENDLEGLDYYLQIYKESNLHKKETNIKVEKKKDDNQKEDILQLNLICTWIVEIYINKLKGNKNSNLDDFRQLIRENLNYLDRGLIYQLLQSYGKMEEFIEFASLMGDYEKVILYYVNQGEIDTALDKLTWFASFSEDQETLNKLTQIFLDNCHIFFKKNPKESISLLQQRFKDVKMESIVQAIMSTTDKDTDNKYLIADKSKSAKVKKDENSQAILNFLKSLVEKPKIEEENNIHNLYIYYLSKNKANQEAILEYLKGPLKNESSGLNNFHKKKEVLFQLDYAKKLFKNNPPAYSLVLALMGKYSEGVKNALKEKTPECDKIAKFIASNAPGEKLKKKLWIDIFSCNNQNEFKQALDIMRESKILKIEDVLPHITDTIKIEEFKKQISKCINDYEANIKKLKEDINDYNKTAENIKGDIYRVKKKSIEITYSHCKCEICQGYIKDKNIFLFPCGHMFDMNCIKESLINYEATGLDYIHEKNLLIDDLFFKLGYSKVKSFNKGGNLKKGETEIETKKQEVVVERGASGFFNKIKNLDFSGFKRQEIQEEKNPKEMENLKNQLYEILSEQCVLCGDFMVDSIQCSLSQRKVELDKDGFKLNLPKEPDFIL